ncbi:zinc ribbon domain-containing protein [Zooshikella ganghwensis]|uniref:zinc ribbon domain-containing protein n=1 Tax=Zooshikella ganghwensis TaxID=202772 RepID=UPI00197DF31E|nr:zinc ribbon domain-containing protein [Zooshikella ganghwensis]
MSKRQIEHHKASFECQSCGYTANADINAAMNILAAGHAVIAGGAGVIRHCCET